MYRRDAKTTALSCFLYEFHTLCRLIVKCEGFLATPPHGRRARMSLVSFRTADKFRTRKGQSNDEVRQQLQESFTLAQSHVRDAFQAESMDASQNISGTGVLYLCAFVSLCVCVCVCRCVGDCLNCYSDVLC